jgi:hypothetical protein
MRELAAEFRRTAEAVEAAVVRERLWKLRSRQRRLSSRTSRKPPRRLSHPRRRASR